MFGITYRCPTSIFVYLMSALALSSCEPNLNTNHPVSPSSTIAPQQAKQTGMAPTSSKTPSPGASKTPTSPTGSSPSPQPSGSIACSAGDGTFQQTTGSAALAWIQEGSSSDFTNQNLSSSALIGLRLNSGEGLYLNVLTDTSHESAVALMHCDSQSVSTPKIMAMGWNTSTASGIVAGDDPSETEDSSLATSCPAVLTSSLIGSETQNLLETATSLQSLSLSSTLLTSGKLQSITVRSSATESLYFALFYSGNQYLAAVLHCDEKTPTQLDVLNVASYGSKGIIQKN